MRLDGSSIAARQAVESTGRREYQSTPTAISSGSGDEEPPRARSGRPASRPASRGPRAGSRSGWPRCPAAEGRVAEDALEDDAPGRTEGHVQRAVDEEGREVDRGERRATGTARAGRAGSVGAPSGSGRGPGETTPIADREPRGRIRPGVRLAADQAERQAADGQRGDDGAEPVEAPGRLGVARFRDMAHRRPQRRTPRSGTLIRNANRQPIVSTMTPPTIGPRTTSADVEAAQMPNARRAPRPRRRG